MFAIIEAGGKQFKVTEGEEICIEKVTAEVGSKLNFNALMVSDGENIKAGTECKAQVEAEVVEHGKGDKIIVYKYKAKKNVRRKQGHRQPYTKIRIVAIK